MQMRNAMELMVRSTLDDILESPEKYGFKELCTCERCQLDIMALALNSLPPRYVVCDRGEVFVRTSALDGQFRVDTFLAVLNAIRLVRINPLH